MIEHISTGIIRFRANGKVYKAMGELVMLPLGSNGEDKFMLYPQSIFDESDTLVAIEKQNDLYGILIEAARLKKSIKLEWMK